MKAIAKYASVAALAVASVSSANAAVYTFDFTGTDNSGTLGAAGNERISTATNGSTSVSVRVTGWDTVDSFTSNPAYLGAFPGGYGVGDGKGDSHTIDNVDLVDFIVLQFDRAVTLTSATFNAFSVSGLGAPDTDATIGAYQTPISWTTAIADPNVFYPGVQGVFNSDVAVNSALPRDISSALYGNTWIIASALPNTDGNYDSFKISQLSISAVPEPATWAMMILGFGVVGASMRRKAAKVSYAF